VGPHSGLGQVGGHLRRLLGPGHRQHAGGLQRGRRRVGPGMGRGRNVVPL
jgi:hypothetical protein